MAERATANGGNCLRDELSPAYAGNHSLDGASALQCDLPRAAEICVDGSPTS